jgi:hypothetical protein
MVQEFQNQDLVLWFSQLFKRSVISLESLPLEKFSETIIQVMEVSSSSATSPPPSSNLLHRVVHENLAHSLPLLRTKEPDFFTTFDKLVIMQTLIQYCSVTSLVSPQIQKISAEISRSPLSEDPNLMSEISSSLQSEIQTVEVPKSAKNSLKCLFSGIESKVDSSIEWVTVPSSLLDPPVMKGILANFGEDEGEGEGEENNEEIQTVAAPAPAPAVTTTPTECQEEEENMKSESEENVEEDEKHQSSVEIPKLRLRKKPRIQRDDAAAPAAVTIKLRAQRKVCIKTNLIKYALARELAMRELENMEV